MKNTSLDDMFDRLDNAVNSGEMTEREAWFEFREILTAERQMEAEREYEIWARE